MDGGSVSAIKLYFSDDETTKIETTDFTDYTDKSGEWYTLSGVRLNAKPTQKGLYIVNGRKVAIK